MTTSTDGSRYTLGHDDQTAQDGSSYNGCLTRLRHRTARITLQFRRHIDVLSRVTKMVELRRPIVYRSLTCPPPLPLVLDTLTNLAELNETVASHTAEVVAIARASGATWHQIGDALGVSKQAAHERFRRLPPPLRDDE